MYDYDMDIIRIAAEGCAAQLANSAEHVSDNVPVCGVAEFAPGDATFYRFIVLAPTPSRRHYLVSLATGFGRSYEWTGDRMSDPGYCGSKWAIGSEAATGKVVSLFLTELALLVGSIHQ